MSFDRIISFFRRSPAHVAPIKYRPEIDGLRAIAVLPVILFHAGFEIFSGGFVGVDVFFVISGYLITSIVIKDLVQDKFSIVSFYERRARRILPALFTVSLVCIPFAWLWMVPEAFDRFGQSLVSVATFSSNIFFWRHADYFAGPAGENPLLHTWSLAVEEQFYLFFPLLLMGLWKKGRKLLMTVIFAIFICSLAISEYGSRFHSSANFYLLPPRAWELMLGALIALTHSRLGGSRKTGGVWHNLISLAGLTLILFSVFAYDESVPFPSAYALLPTMGTGLILHFGSTSGLCGKLLSARLLVFIGLISYSAYLWHQPLFAFAEILYVSTPPAWLFLLLSALSLILAWLSWQFIERPFRTRGTLSPRSIWVVSATFMSITIVIGVSLHGANGVPSRMPSSYVSNDWGALLRPNRGLNEACDFKGNFELNAKCVSGNKPNVLLWGDSYAMHLADGLAAANVSFVQATRSACGPNFSDAPYLDKIGYNKTWTKQCFEFAKQVEEFLRTHPEITTVVMSSPFRQYTQRDMYDGEKFYSPSFDERVQGFVSTIDRIRALGKRPVIVAPPPTHTEEISKCLRRQAANLLVMSTTDTGSDCSFPKVQYEKYNADVIGLLRALEHRAKIPVIWIAEFTCQQKVCVASEAGIPLYRGGGHLSHDGSAYLFRRYDIASKIFDDDAR